MSAHFGFHRTVEGWACDEVLLDDLASRFGTPAYVYSGSLLEARYRRLVEAFSGLDIQVCYSVKASSNLSILARLASWGAGFDIVSGGELHRVLRAGGDPSHVFFAGVGKQDWEIDFALREGVGRLNAESEDELKRISARAAAQGTEANVALRVNPDVDPATHRYITTGRRENKFGVPFGEAAEVIRRAEGLPGLLLNGLHCHIGSQICDVEPFVLALRRLLELADRVGSERFEHFDLGGGFGIDYGDGRFLDLSALAEALRPVLEGRKLKIILEPGRFLMAHAGGLLTRVLDVKQGEAACFVVVDAGMNDLMRPSLYGARHRIDAVREVGSTREVQVVGPICETADFLSESCQLPEVSIGSLLIVHDAGAYGFSMASQYNSRPRPPEILVEGSTVRVIRPRESLDDLVRSELEVLDS